MNYINKLALLLTLAFGLLACSKEQGAEPTSQEVATQLLPIEITSELLAPEADADELRSIHQVKTDGTTGKLVLSNKDLSIRIAVRRAGGTPVYSTLTFKKQTGKNAVKYVGQVRVPQNGSGAFEISAVVLGEVRGRAYAKLSGDKVQAIAATALSKPAAGTVTTQIPYVAGWTSMPLDAAGNVLRPVTLTFKPSGTLLALSILNDTEAAHTVKAIKIKSNAFVSAWEYDFTKIGVAGDLVEGQALGTPSVDASFTIAEETLQAGAKTATTYYLWVMPKVATTEGLKTEFVVTTATGDFTLMPLTTPLKTGTVPAVLKLSKTGKPILDIKDSCFPDKKLPIEYLAHYDVNAAGTGFATAFDNSPAGGKLFTWDEAVAAYGQDVTIGGKQYYLPTQQQMRAIFPIIGGFTFTNVGFRRREDSEVIHAGGETYTTFADYSHPNDNKILYALRLQNKAMCMVTAYRYELLGPFTAGDPYSHMKVTCRYLGHESWTIGDIENEDFWRENTEKDYVRYLSAPLKSGAGAKGSYWTSSQNNTRFNRTDGERLKETNADDFFFGQYRTLSGTGTTLEMGGSYSSKTSRFRVRLMGRQVEAARSVPGPVAP